MGNDTLLAVIGNKGAPFRSHYPEDPVDLLLRVSDLNISSITKKEAIIEPNVYEKLIEEVEKNTHMDEFQFPLTGLFFHTKNKDLMKLDDHNIH